VSTNNRGFTPFGTRSVQLSERKRGRLLPKRHQIKHLEFVVSWFGTRGSEVQILSPRPTYLKSSDYRQEDALQTSVVVASSSRFSIQALFKVNSLGTGMSPYATTKGSKVRMVGYPAEGERLRHFTTTRSKRSVYRQSNKEVPKTARIPWQPFHNRTPAIEAPPGFTFLTGDAYPPGATVENRVDIFRNGFTGGWFNTVFAKAHERGGHFGPWENPDAFIHLLVINSARGRRARDVRLSRCQNGARESQRRSVTVRHWPWSALVCTGTFLQVVERSQLEKVTPEILLASFS
jgi:hypothetical protein